MIRSERVEEEEEGSGESKEEEEEEEEEEVTLSLKPPVDDCCAICFGNFTVACKSNCGHWYCAACILQYWNYAAASKPCKCPMCSRFILNLTPESSLQGGHHLEDVSKLLKDVDRYNRLFVGGIPGLLQKIYELPLLMKRVFRQMMDPDGHDYLSEVRLFAMMLSILYASTPFDFIPNGGMGIVRLFDYTAFAVVLSLRLVGHYRRWRLNRRLAAAPPQMLDE
ncbi:hypothetical protein ACFE04_023190 [Oxalis oulophora]